MNFFVTNREILTDKGKEFIREDGREAAGDNLRFGTYNLANRAFSLFPEPSNEADMIYAMGSSQKTEELVGSFRFFREIYEQLIHEGKNRTDVLFFIHGFNTDLEGVRNNIATLHKKYVANKDSPIEHIVIFTWPGRSPKLPFHYRDDKKDAIRSGEVLARGMKKLIKFFQKFLYQEQNKACEQKIHLMVHSMGHRVLKHLMLELKSLNTPVPEIFTEVILMAADIEYDIFEPNNAFDELIDFGDRVHVYYHKEDRVLDISKYTKNFSNRLGRLGRKRLDPALQNVFDANVSRTSDDTDYGLRENILNHWYYYTSSEVVNDVIKVLQGGNSSYFKDFR